MIVRTKPPTVTDAADAMAERCDVGLIVAVDRENVRFAACRTPSAELEHKVTWPVECFATFIGAIEAYLREVPTIVPRAMVISVAGVPAGDVVSVTGGRWRIALSGIRDYLKIAATVLNDFAACAFAIPTLPDRSLRRIGLGSATPERTRGTIALVGGSDGLGTAGLIRDAKGWTAVQSEAGNAGLALIGEDGALFCAEMMRRHGHLTAEHLLTQRGLVTAYEILANGRRARDHDQVIIEARAGDAASTRAYNLFLTGLGTYCHNIVMTLGAWNGLYFTGRLSRAIAIDLDGPVFRAAFERRGAYRARMLTTPMHLVQDDDLEMVGAAAALPSHGAEAPWP